MNLRDDPQRELRISLFKQHCIEVFEKAKKHYGKSKYQKGYPALILETEDDDNILGGEYCFENNEITINYQGFDDSDDCYEYYTRLICHEFVHHLQHHGWFKRYYKMGHDYLTHPYEIEAYKRETELL